MNIGIVKWFDPEKGFGVLGTPDNEEFFLHINSFLSKPEKILKRNAVVFTKREDLVRNKNKAEKCRFVGDFDDWKTALDYLGKQDDIGLEIEIVGTGKRGNRYLRRENQFFSLVELATEQYFKLNDEQVIVNSIIHYFDFGLDKTHFLSYCELIESTIVKLFRKEKVTNILNLVFSHFGQNLDEEKTFLRFGKKRKLNTFLITTMMIMKYPIMY